MKATPFLMFQGQAASALALYARTFPDFQELLRQDHPPGEMSGQVAMARIRIAGQDVMLNDSPPVHDFTFTPASWLFIECDSAEQLRHIAGKLADGGNYAMPVDAYGFSALFCWVVDRFGVSWQLNLA